MREITWPNSYRGQTMTAKAYPPAGTVGVLSCWLAAHSAEKILHIGCQRGARTKLIAEENPVRTIYAVDWSFEHRIDLKQKRPVFMARHIGDELNKFENVSVINIDPSTLPLSAFQPISFALIDYDYSLDGLRRVSEPILEAIPELGTPGAVIAWAGFREPWPEEKNDVMRYLYSLEAGDIYHVKNTELAFRVYNATTGFRNELRSLAVI